MCFLRSTQMGTIGSEAEDAQYYCVSEPLDQWLMNSFVVHPTALTRRFVWIEIWPFWIRIFYAWPLSRYRSVMGTEQTIAYRMQICY